MTRAKAGAGALLLLFILSVGANSAPQENAQKPAICSTIDSAVKGISGYNMKDQAAVADDGEFLRRVMLDLVGYPPNLDQVKAFMAETAPNKRVAKIDELLATDDFADLWARMFAEVFFGNYHDVTMDTMPKLAKASSARIVGDFLKWFKLKLNKDTPWTEIVSQMLDARGTDEGDPAMAYKLSFYTGEGQAIEFANGVARHLLGIRLVCARCHDHPFDKWRVEDYYGLADFVYRQKARGYGNGGEKDSVDHVELKYADEGDIMMPNLSGSKDAEVKLAHGGPAAPNFLFGGAAGKNDDRMKVLAMFMTNKANTQLPRALVNRCWAWLMGRGVVHPVDDFNLKNKAMATALLEAMVRDTIENKYSVKRIIRAICNTEAYQRGCSSDTAALKTNFSRATVKQLNGEQLLNSIKVATQGKPERATTQTMEMVGSLYPAGAVWCEVTPLPGNARQALLLRNNTQIMSWVNGPVLAKVKSAAGSVEEKIDLMFLSALSRVANDSEKKRYAAFIGSHSGSGWEDAYWTLMNSTEFVTRH
ncbi:MAG TPA: DUF1549 domain-containing protein [Planctomycetota bacterium]|nr:DUF1549 domain-containing protein [Planctomycetota bacterium]